MASNPSLPPARHVEFKKEGWGAAILTCVATVAVFLGAWYIHAQTFREPTDVMMRAVGEQPIEPAQAAASEHGAAPATAPAGAQGAAPAGAPAAAPAAGH